MLQMEEELVCIDDALLAETQVRLNDLFAADLFYPIYLIRSPEPHAKPLMSVSGGASCHYYRDKINDWKGPGFVLKVYRDEMTAPLFYGILSHEIAHCFMPTLSRPWCGLPEDMGWPPVPKTDLKPVFGTPLDDFNLHQPEFWRVAYHVWSRFVKAGFPCSHRHLGIRGDDSDRLLEAIEPEIEELADQPLWKLVRRPMPRQFTNIFYWPQQS